MYVCVHACACVCVQSKLLNVKLLCDITAARQQKQQQPSDPVVGTSIHAYIHTCLKCAFVCVYLCVSEVYRSCLCVIISWCACVCVCVGIYLQLSGRLCLASHMNLIYACVCACVYVCLGTVHKSEYIAIGTITYTHTHTQVHIQLHVQAALQLSSLCYIARCRVQLTDSVKRETRERDREGERRHLPVRKQLCTGVCLYMCVHVCVCATLY